MFGTKLNKRPDLNIQAIGTMFESAGILIWDYPFEDKKYRLQKPLGVKLTIRWSTFLDLCHPALPRMNAGNFKPCHLIEAYLKRSNDTDRAPDIRVILKDAEEMNKKVSRR